MTSQILGLALWIQSKGQGITFVDLRDTETQPTLAWVILTALALIGIALLVAVGIGAGVGLLRIWIRKRFPNNRFNGRDVEPLTFLHLNDHPDHEGSSSL